MSLFDRPRKRSCVLSPDEVYRYRLEETLPRGEGILVWVMVNPSTADADADDATIRKVRGFTERFGFGRWVVVNLFAFRTKNIVECRSANARGAAVGTENDANISAACAGLDVVCAWGPKPWAYPRARAVAQLLQTISPRIHALGFAQDGAPLHPLTLSYDRALVPYTEKP